MKQFCVTEHNVASFSEVINIFDWIGDLISGIGDAVGSALSSAWQAISSNIFDIFMEWLYKIVYYALANFFEIMSGMGVKLFDLSWTQAALKFFQLFGWGLFVVGIAVAVFDFAVEYQSYGRANIKTTLLNIMKGFFAVSLFTVVPVELYRFSVSLQNTFSHDLTEIFVSELDGMEDLARQVLNLYSPTLNANYGLFSLLTIIALGYCVIKVFFSNIKRGGILLTQISVGTLYMFSIPRGYADGFIQWGKQVIALCLTTFMQTSLLFLGLMTWKTDMLLGLGVMLAANEVPRIAQTFGLDTSVHMNMMSVVHTTTTAVNMTRSLFRK